MSSVSGRNIDRSSEPFSGARAVFDRLYLIANNGGIILGPVHGDQRPLLFEKRIQRDTFLDLLDFIEEDSFNFVYSWAARDGDRPRGQCDRKRIYPLHRIHRGAEPGRRRPGRRPAGKTETGRVPAAAQDADSARPGTARGGTGGIEGPFRRPPLSRQDEPGPDRSHARRRQQESRRRVRSARARDFHGSRDGRRRRATTTCPCCSTRVWV